MAKADILEMGQHVRVRSAEGIEHQLRGQELEVLSDDGEGCVVCLQGQPGCLRSRVRVPRAWLVHGGGA